MQMEFKTSGLPFRSTLNTFREKHTLSYTQKLMLICHKEGVIE